MRVTMWSCGSQAGGGVPRWRFGAAITLTTMIATSSSAADAELGVESPAESAPA